MEKSQNTYQWILDVYPEFITKEQLYKICKVSKKTAQHYLISGVIPCQNSGKRTRQYTIRTKDVVAFLRQRDLDPQSFGAPGGWYRHGKRLYRPRVHSPIMQKKLISALTQILDHYPDVMSSQEAAQATGYCHSTIVTWCKKKKLEYFAIRGGFLIPKECLLAYLSSERCHAINDTAKEHILMTARQLLDEQT